MHCICASCDHRGFVSQLRHPVGVALRLHPGLLLPALGRAPLGVALQLRLQLALHGRGARLLRPLSLLLILEVLDDLEQRAGGAGSVAAGVDRGESAEGQWQLCTAEAFHRGS